MSPAEAALRDARAAGLAVELDRDRIHVRGRLSENLRRRLRAHRGAVLELLRTELAPSGSNPLRPLASLPPLAPGETFAVWFTHGDGALVKVRGSRLPAKVEPAPAVVVAPTGEAAELVRWFEEARGLGGLPTEPFRLNDWTMIAPPEVWYSSLAVDIQAGPKGLRAGVLIEQLRRLREIVETNNSPA